MAILCDDPNLRCPLCGEKIGSRVILGAGPQTGAVGTALDGLVAICRRCAAPIQWFGGQWFPMKEADVKKHHQYEHMKRYAGGLLEKIWG